MWDLWLACYTVCLPNCTSLREIQHGLEVCQGKLNHLHLNRVQPRSTLSDGNKKSPSKIFGAIYPMLYEAYKPRISDSTLKDEITKRLFILDSTTISLFKAILKSLQDESAAMAKAKAEEVNS